MIVVDDELDIREALYTWLSKNYAVDCFESAATAIDAIKTSTLNDGIPTCILIDLNMPYINGIELQSNLMQLNVRYPIIFMSGSAMQTDIIQAWQGGAMDFLLKPFSPSQISEAIEKAFDRLEKSRYLTTAIPSENTRIDIPITRREAQVLLLLGKGLQQTEVANQLDISLRTVKMYLTFIKNKLNLNSQMALARYCDKHCKSIELIANSQ